MSEAPAAAPAPATPPATPAAPAAPAAPATPAAPAAPATPATPDATKPAEPATPAEPAKPAVPEKYELKLSDQSVLDPTIVDKVAAIAREQGLSNEQAQERLKQIDEQALAERNENVKRWNDEVKADKELGGANLQQTEKFITLARDRFIQKDSPLDALLTRSGFGSHPAVVRHFVELGKAMAEDKPLSAQAGGGTAGGQKSAAERLYGSKT